MYLKVIAASVCCYIRPIFIVGAWQENRGKVSISKAAIKGAYEFSRLDGGEGT